LDETGGKVPTNKPDPVLVQEILDSSDGQKVTLEDLIRAKARRETRAKVDGINGNYPKDYMNIFSHGELILVTEVLQRDGPGIPIDWFKAWVLEERLPEGLNPPHITGLLDVHSKTDKVSKELAALHAAANKRRDA
jgi:Peroxidase, family 2